MPWEIWGDEEVAEAVADRAVLWRMFGPRLAIANTYYSLGTARSFRGGAFGAAWWMSLGEQLDIMPYRT